MEVQMTRTRTNSITYRYVDSSHSKMREHMYEVGRHLCRGMMLPQRQEKEAEDNIPEPSRVIVVMDDSVPKLARGPEGRCGRMHATRQSVAGTNYNHFS